MSLFGTKEKEEIVQLKGLNMDLQRQNAQFQEELSKLREENARLHAQLTPEHVHLATLKDRITESKKRLAEIGENVQKSKAKLENLQSQIVETDETVLLQSFGMYTPHYSYTTSDEYKQRLKTNREQQKSRIKSGDAVTGNENWTVNGSLTQGRKLV